MARPSRGGSLTQQLLFEGELRVATTLEAVRAACALEGVPAPPLQTPPSGAEQIVLLSAIQLGGVVLTQVDRKLSTSPALPIAWQLHQRALAEALAPLERLEAGLRRFARFWPFAQWSMIGFTLLIGAVVGVDQLYSALRRGLLTMVGFAALALVQYLVRLWLRRYFVGRVLNRWLGSASVTPTDDR